MEITKTTQFILCFVADSTGTCRFSQRNGEAKLPRAGTMRRKRRAVEPTNHLDLATKEMLVEALKDFEGTMIFVSHDRMFLRGLGSRVLELGGESGIERDPVVYPGSYVEYVRNLGHEAPGIYS